MDEESEDYKKYILNAESELRIEIQHPDERVQVMLFSGFAEIFGTELIEGHKYKFQVGAKLAIFTYLGCVVYVTGNPDVCYISEETPMLEYKKCHTTLEKERVKAEEKDVRGPIAMVVGPKGVGKSTFCRILLNYAARLGRRPLYVDVDVGQGAVTIPGTIGTILVDKQACVEQGFSVKAPKIYHFGHKSPSENTTLYKAVVSKMAKVTLESMNENKETKHSGVIINTCGWVDGGGYQLLVYTAKALEVDTVFVLDQQRLYKELVRDMPSFVRVDRLAKNRGAVELSRHQRAIASVQRTKEYFYGTKSHYNPYSVEVKFCDLRLYKIDMNTKNNNTTLVAVTPSLSILHHILAVSLAKTTKDDVIGINLAGFVCVIDVDMECHTIRILSPQLRLPNTLLLLSDIKFVDSTPRSQNLFKKYS